MKIRITGGEKNLRIHIPDWLLFGRVTAWLVSNMGGKYAPQGISPDKMRILLEELTLRIYVNSAGGDRVKVNLPMSLVKVALEIGIDLTASMGGSEAMTKSDLNKIVELVERGMIGKIVEVESSDGDTVEVVVE